MPEKKYSLEWNSYSDHLRNMMKEMLINDHFSDVTLVTEDKKHLKAHLNILSACSPFFKDILRKQNNSMIYLRGIHFEEVESILQFIYLGKTSVQEEMLNEFLSVARSLEIKELSNAETSYSNDEIDDKPSACEGVTIGAESSNETTDDNDKPSGDIGIFGEETKETKTQCDNQAIYKEGGKYACNQCDYQNTHKGNLKQHIRSKHEGVKYACDQCDKQFFKKFSLAEHIKGRHQGRKFACSECDYETTHQSTLKAHVRALHEGVEYNCNLCDFKASWKATLQMHKMQKH